MNYRQKAMPAGRQGFTLIELLVVIAIIGILAALVLVALGNARDKANDARIKSNIGQLRTLAEVHYDSNSTSYANFASCIGSGTAAQVATDCAGGIAPSVLTLVTDSELANSTASSVIANSNATAFCVSTNLKSSATTFVCADSTGKFASASCAAATACP